MDFPELNNEEQAFYDEDTSLLEETFGSQYQYPKPQIIATYYEIDELNLPTKIRNICINKDIVTIELLRKAFDNGTLAACRGIGPGALKIVRCKLENPNYIPPEKDEVTMGHIRHLQALYKRAKTECDEDSMYTLLWVINKLYNSID